MKKLMLVFLSAMIFLVSNAQDKRGKKDCNHQKHHRKDMVMKNLNLTDDQRKQMQAHKENYKNQMEELKKNQNITVKEFNERKEALRKEKKAKMDALLTAEQKAKLEQAKKDKEQKHALKAQKKLEKMQSHLNLSNEQVAKIKAENEAFHSKLKALKENESLSREEKKQQITALKEAKKESFRKILTPEQWIKMEEMRKKKMDKTSKT